MKRAMTWIAVAFIILGVLLGGFMAIGIYGGWGFDFGGLGQSVATLANRRTFTMQQVENLNILYRSDDVTFEVTNGDELILEEYMSNPSQSKFASVSEGGNTLRIEQGERSSDWFMFYNISYAIIYIPADWHGNLDAECSSGSLRTEQDWQFASIRLQANSGSLRFKGLDCDGNVSMGASSGAVSADRVTAAGNCTLQATSGSVKISEVDAAGSLTATTTSGSLKFDSARAADIRMQANSGSVKVGDITGVFDLSTTSGSIHVDGGQGHGSAVASSGSVKVTLGDVTGDMRLETTSGSVKFNIPRSLSFTFEADTSSGSINADFKDELSFNDKGNHATGTIGEDPELHIYCKASSGSVKVEY